MDILQQNISKQIMRKLVSVCVCQTCVPMSCVSLPLVPICGPSCSLFLSLLVFVSV